MQFLWCYQRHGTRRFYGKKKKYYVHGDMAGCQYGCCGCDEKLSEGKVKPKRFAENVKII